MMVDDPNSFLELIKSKKSEIRKILGQKIGKQVRIVPDINFYLDHTEENAQRIENILADLNIPPAPEDEETKE